MLLFIDSRKIKNMRNLDISPINNRIFIQYQAKDIMDGEKDKYSLPPVDDNGLPVHRRIFGGRRDSEDDFAQHLLDVEEALKY